MSQSSSLIIIIIFIFIFCPCRLNDVRVDDCQWSAQLLPKVTTNSMTNGSDAKAGVGSQISNLIGGLKEQLQMKRIYLEDLENLHHAILHLKECSSTGHQ